MKLTKEKEPESAATDTSSVGCIKKTDGDTVSLSKDTTIEAKCQVLLKYIKRDLYGIYEKLSQAERNAWDLGEMYARVTDHLTEEQFSLVKEMIVFICGVMHEYKQKLAQIENKESDM